MPKHNPFGKIGDSSPPESPAKKGNEPEPERTLLVKHDVCVYRIPPQVLNICHDDDDNHEDDDDDEPEMTHSVLEEGGSEKVTFLKQLLHFSGPSDGGEWWSNERPHFLDILGSIYGQK